MPEESADHPPGKERMSSVSDDVFVARLNGLRAGVRPKECTRLWREATDLWPPIKEGRGSSIPKHLWEALCDLDKAESNLRIALIRAERHQEAINRLRLEIEAAIARRAGR